MCGRYELVATVEQLAMRFELPSLPEPLTPQANVTPGQANPVIVVRSPRRMVSMRWGLVPAWAPDPQHGPRPINARVETVADKPSFRTALRHSRCLVPATAYYEWPPPPPGRPKQPVRLALAGELGEVGRLFAFAGLYDTWRGQNGEMLETYTILTQAAQPELTALHPRMPVILTPGAEAAWLDPALSDPAELLALLSPEPTAFTVTPMAALLPDPPNVVHSA